MDSNIWLSLYYFTNDDLEQFKKLKEMVGKSICLFVTQQVVDEVRRNRDAKIKETLKTFKSLDFKFPAFSKQYEEYTSFYKKYNELRGLHQQWQKKIDADVKEQKLPADEVIKDFWDSVDIIPHSSGIEQKAEIRYKKGNPPGKDNKYGDAINWEMLLENVPNEEDIFFISADGDFASPLDAERFNLFLSEEWKVKKRSKVIFFKSLSSFISEHIGNITLETEKEKEELIASLSASYNFSNTHAIINRLSMHSGWTSQQIEDLCAAALDNTQVGWILGDDDLTEFFSNLLELPNAQGENASKLQDYFMERFSDEEDVNSWLQASI